MNKQAFDEWIKDRWQEGSKVEIYSESYEKWCEGHIKSIFDHNKEKCLEVQYFNDMIKEISRNNAAIIRPPSQASNVDFDKNTKGSGFDDKTERLNWVTGSKCLVYSKMKKGWTFAKISNVYTDKEGEWVTIEHISDANIKQDIQRFSQDIMPIYYDKDIKSKYKTLINTKKNIIISSIFDVSQDEQVDKIIQRIDHSKNNKAQQPEEKKDDKKSKQKADDAQKITLFEWKDMDKGKQWRTLFAKLPKYGTIEYEKPNQFWSIALGKKWTNSRKKFSTLTDKLYKGTDWYKKGIERGNKWAKDVNEANPKIKTIPPTSCSGAHITLGRIDKNSNDCPKCFKEGGKVNFEILKLICHPPFRNIPKNLPGQTTVDNGKYRFYATHWMSLAIRFVDFDFQTKFPPHISLCNIAVKLKIKDVA